MRKHDPLLNVPEPLVLVLPVLEALLAGAGLRPGRERIRDRFLKGARRVLVVSGSADHPAHIYDHRLVPLLAREIWNAGGLPFSACVPSLCDGVAQGHEGMEFSLNSRDLSEKILSGQIIGHHYDAAIFLAGCDKDPSAFLAAAVRVDAFYQKRFGKNFYFLFLNTPVMRDGRIPGSVKKKLCLSAELEELARSPLRCNTFARYHRLLSGPGNAGGPERKEELLKELALYVCPAGGTCGFMGTGSTSKVVLYGLGLVPDEYAWPSPGDYLKKENAGKAVSLLFSLMKGKKDTLRILKNNFSNALKAAAAVRGSLNWVLHFQYLAFRINYKKDPLLSLRGVPCFLDGEEGLSGMARKGKMFSLFKELLLRKIIRDRETLAGPWGRRLGNRRTLFWPSSGVSHYLSFGGNLFKRALIKLSPAEHEALKKFHRQTFLCLVYHSEEELIRDLMKKGCMEKRIKKALGGKKTGPAPVAVFLLGQGMKARGMPEMYYASEYLNREKTLQGQSILVTDGRFSGATYGFCFGYMEPEYADSVKLKKLKSGHCVQFDFYKRRIDRVG